MNFASYESFENRTAGMAPKSQTIQAWKIKKADPLPESQNNILNNLETAQKRGANPFGEELRTAMAYAPQQPENQDTGEAFQFRDVVDIVNPLQHLPLVNMVYRSITNDKIGPAAQIIGGAVFGGPIGAVAGTVNAITQIKTGKEMGEHMMAFAGLKTDLQSGQDLEQVAARYEKINLDHMPSVERIQTFSINS